MKGGKSNDDHSKNNKRKLAVNNTTTTKLKTANDPNKPMRPLSPFFMFMTEFRRRFQEEHPHNKSIATMGKAGGTKWKAMSDAVSSTCFNMFIGIKTSDWI
ncbi:hypothetical protein QVD17_28982 [Tagetes erecta]|uniref:HMG box domain-containing protein n=1 Tax=Tagetes erecta TaxID=13708 RepID=A0AAD8KDQ1_TARER|nr:hypothetical protein QVD17_28982 [Tagetes erecta]